MRSAIIQPEELSRLLASTDLRLFDCRFRLDDPGAGGRLWSKGHIPDACFADIERDLSSPVGPTTGRHPLPEAETFIAWCQRHGVDQQTHVVCYDDAGGAFAARLWWLLAIWLDHPHVSLLDGGIDGWRGQGGYLSTETPQARIATDWSPHPRGDRVISSATLATRAADWRVIDARTEERFRGQQEPIDPVAGHIPGALNRPFSKNLDADQRWRAAGEFADEFTRLLDQHPPNTAVHMCGSGITACHNVLAMEQAGLHGSRLYAGSWSEWIQGSERPVATEPTATSR